MSTILAIETATNACSCALLKGGDVFVREQVAPRQHTNLVLSQVDALLVEAGCTLSDIDAFAFGQGPGSFMGVRLAASVTQAFAFSHNKPVIAVSTLQALAQRCYVDGDFDQVQVAWDARMNEIYTGDYVLQDDIMTAISPDRVCAPTEFDRKDDFTWVGNAFSLYLDLEPWRELFPSAKEVVIIAAQKWASGEVQDAHNSVPNYVRNKVTY